MGQANSISMTDLDTRFTGYANAVAANAQTAAQTYADGQAAAAKTYADNEWSKQGGWKDTAQTAAQNYADNEWSKQGGWKDTAQTAAQNYADNKVADIWNQEQTFQKKLTVANGLTVGGPSAFNGVVGLTDTLTAAPGKGIVYGGMSMFDKDGKTCLGTAGGVPIFCMDPSGTVTNSAGQNVYLVTSNGPTLSPLIPPTA
jgi:hypothetical protein